MSTYPEYKDSGIEWIGEIPKDWELKKLKYLFELKTGRDPSSVYVDQGGFKVYGTGGEIGRSSEYMYDGPSLILGRKGTIDNPFLVDEPFWISDVVYCTVPKTKMETYYLRYLSSLIPFEYFKYGSTLPSMGKSDYENMSFPVPSLPEQKKISCYLDRKTQKIDDLIEKIKVKTKLLKEKKSSLINQCVTKGLEPNIKMKDSGIEWIEEIPEDWELIRLKYLSNISTGNRNTEDSEEEGEFPFFVRSQTVEKISTYSFDGEAILTAGDGVGVGKVFHYFNGQFDYHQRVYKFSHFNKVFGKFLFYYMKENLFNELLRWNAKSTVDSVRLPFLENFMVPVPPFFEQKKISDYLDKETSKIDQMVETENKRIELLKEYRQSLVSNVLTGKIDVRDEVIQ